MNGYFVDVIFKIVLLDDYDVVCYGICIYLFNDWCFDVVGSYGYSNVLLIILVSCFVDVVIVDYVLLVIDVEGFVLVW